MRIVHINTHDIEGGAAKVAWNLMHAQRRAGHDVHLLVGRKKSDDPAVITLDPRPDPVLELFCQEANVQYLHFQGSFDLAQQAVIRAADVVHLHNIHFDYCNPVVLSALSQAKPVVWTMHDMFALTGFCNHAFDCQAWRTGCRGCDRRIIDRTDPRYGQGIKGELAALGIETAFRIKRQTYRASDLHVVSPSAWLDRKVGQSMLACQPHRVIYNGVDVRVFKPGDKVRARQELGLPQEAFIVGGAAVYGVFAHPLKGGALIGEAFARLRKRHPEALFLNIGADAPSSEAGIVNVPYIRDEQAMARAYAAMDVFFHAAPAETFCLVAAEALASGRPVVACATGPLPEIVRHGRDGLLAPAGDATALAACAARLAADPAEARRLGESGRERALACFDFERTVAEYGALYEEAIAARARTSRAPRLFDRTALPCFVQTPAFCAAEAAKCRPDLAVPVTVAPAAETEALLDRFVASVTAPRAHALFARMLANIRDYRDVFRLRGEGRFDEAVAVLDRLLGTSLNEPMLMRTMGVTLGLAGRHEAAWRWFDACMNAVPPMRDIWLTVADMYRLAGDLDRSWEAVTRMASLDPLARGIGLRKGLILEARGDFAGAAAQYASEYAAHGDAQALDKQQAAERAAQAASRTSATNPPS